MLNVSFFFFLRGVPLVLILIYLFLKFCLFFPSLHTIWKEIQGTQCFRHSLEQLLWTSAMGAITLWTGSCTAWTEQRSSLTLQPLLEHSGEIQTAVGCCSFSINWTSELLSEASGAPCWGLGIWVITSLFCLHGGTCILLPLKFWATSLFTVTESLWEFQLHICGCLVSETQLTSVPVVFWKLISLFRLST